MQVVIRHVNMQFCCMYVLLHVKMGNKEIQLSETSGQRPAAPGTLHSPHGLGHFSKATEVSPGVVHKLALVSNGLQSAPAAKNAIYFNIIILQFFIFYFISKQI